MFHVYTFLILSFLTFSGCKTNNEKDKQTFNKSDINNHNHLIKDYLNTKIKVPDVIINATGHERINFFDINIEWHEVESGIEIVVNGDTIYTKNAITLNDVWDADKDSVNFANNLIQVKYYDFEKVKLLGFVFTNDPCTGLGCSVNYQLVYDLNKKTTNYFGRFRTGEELELYNFMEDNSVIDYISKTFYGRNETLIDTTTFEIYRRDVNGKFHLVKDSLENKYFIKLIDSWELETFADKMESYWPEEITN